jgi:phage shock protein A
MARTLEYLNRQTTTANTEEVTMSVIKRLTTTLFSRVDQMVSEIENHDAVIEAAIREARQNTARAKVRLARVHADSRKLRDKQAELAQAEARWAERARNLADNAPDKALECVRRRRECQTQIKRIESALAQHDELEKRLQRDVQGAESRITEMAQQRNLMRTRESATAALTSIVDADENFNTEIADVFERWEIKITEGELSLGNIDNHDSLERECFADEERQSLQAELKQLLADKEVRDDN